MYNASMKPILLIVPALLLAGCAATGKAPEGQEAPAFPPVYVADFTLAAADPSAAAAPAPETGPLRRRLGSLRRSSADPADQAREVQDLLAETIVADLKKKGIGARRLSPEEPLPSAGWLVRGGFVEVEEGNRLRRAAVGFGSGAAGVSLHVVAEDLSARGGQPLVGFDAASEPGKTPGAVVMMNPYAAAAKFALDRNDLEKATAQAASAIAAAVAKNLAPAPGPRP